MSEVEKETRHLETLEQALQWARTRTPRALPLETIPQDEYTHDVIFQTRENEFVVFDAT
jgi:hypothetical protein